MEVLQDDGSYAPLVPGQTYTLASHNYLIKQGGDGLTMFMDNPLIIDECMADYQILITYMASGLGGAVGSEYANAANRITIQ